MSSPLLRIPTLEEIENFREDAIYRSELVALRVIADRYMQGEAATAKVQAINDDGYWELLTVIFYDKAGVRLKTRTDVHISMGDHDTIERFLAEELEGAIVCEQYTSVFDLNEELPYVTPLWVLEEIE